MSDFGFAAAQGIADLAAQSLGTYYDKKSQKRAFDYNTKMAEWQNEQNIKNWQMQNEYNLPVNQMKRLADAGLNPNLVYGNGNATTTAGSVHSTPGATMNAYQGHYRVADAISRGLDNMIKAASIRKTNQETSNLGETQKSIVLNRMHTQLQNDYQSLINAKTDYEKRIWSQKLDLELKQMRAEIGLTESNTDLINAKTDNEIIAYSMNQTKLDILGSQAVQEYQKIGLNQLQADKLVQDINNAILEGRIKMEDIKNLRYNNEFNRILQETGINYKSQNVVDTTLRYTRSALNWLEDNGKIVLRGAKRVGQSFINMFNKKN